MESDTYFSVYSTHKSKRCSTQPPACSEKSYQIYLCIGQQERFTEAEPLPVQGYWAVLAYTGIEEASNKIKKKKCVSIRVKKFSKQFLL